VKEASEGKRENLSDFYVAAAMELESILTLRQEIYDGEWKKWFSFEKKLDIAGMFTLLKTMAEDFRLENSEK
jgi:hypothetical protein